MYHLYVLKVTETSTLWITQATPCPRVPLEFHFHGLHWETTFSGYHTNLIIVDWLTKQSIFVSTVDTITAPMLAQLFVIHVFSKHRVPLHVIYNCGLKFMSSFFCTLGKALDMKLHFTSDYHPEGDRQMEHINQTLEQYLQVYCNYQQDNWSDLLPIAEFA